MLTLGKGTKSFLRYHEEIKAERKIEEPALSYISSTSTFHHLSYLNILYFITLFMF